MWIILSFLTPYIPSYAIGGTFEEIAAVKSKMEARTPPLRAKSIKATPINGLYEVFVQGNLIYTDKNFSYVIFNGSMIEMNGKKNLTDESIKQLSKINFSNLPLQNAIEIRKGSGAFKFAVFSDPDCPFCKSLESALAEAEIDDYTAYIFLLPLTNLHPEAAVKSESIWCAKDKAEAWTNLMLRNIAPEKANCSNPIAANEKIAEEIGVGGTPSIYLYDGSLIKNPQDLLAAIAAKK
jgi:thiol:disulfide interchange protein DsbC